VHFLITKEGNKQISVNLSGLSANFPNIFRQILYVFLSLVLNKPSMVPGENLAFDHSGLELAVSGAIAINLALGYERALAPGGVTAYVDREMEGKCR
jgi:hypothetical protein